jgi:hypothetical protein
MMPGHKAPEETELYAGLGDGDMTATVDYVRY